jgi:hypothetical protein
MISVKTKFKWTYTKSPIQVVADDGMIKPGFIAPELVCFTIYGQALGSVDLPDEYNPKETYPCRVMVEGVTIKAKFECVKEAMNWVEKNAAPAKAIKRSTKILPENDERDVDDLFRKKR